MPDPPRPAVGLGGAPPARASAADAPAPQGVVQRLPVIPERYTTREKDGQRTLECDEAPRLRVVIDAEMAASRSEAGALGERVILLDGAGHFAPLIDNDRRLYNLDHHAGCERLFTLATCEQALLLVHGGLDLAEGDWTVYANEPDLDTVLAIWCLLNHRRLPELKDEALDLLLPVLRLEGAIDANGPALARLCGLPGPVLAEAQQRIDQLHSRERALKQTGSWARKDVYAYTAEVLRAVVALVYTHEDFGDYTRIEEVYGHVEIAPRRVAVACRDRAGIYTVEQHLKDRWGDQLAVICLENQPGQYTLRRVGTLAGPDLEPAYEMLNRIDPAVDGRPPGKRWGGSQDIGGSPRPRGTYLASAEVLAGLERAYRRHGAWGRLAESAGALFAGLAFLLFWPVAAVLPSLPETLAASAETQAAFELALLSGLALGVGAIATRVASGHKPWVFGWRSPAPGRWPWLAPLVVIPAVLVSAWTPLPIATHPTELAAAASASVLAVAAAEVWFRGLVHGLLGVDFPVQRPDGPWFVSRGVFVSAVAYAAVATLQSEPLLASVELPWLALDRTQLLAVIAGATFTAGIALGVIRERSLSLVPGFCLHLLGAAAAATAWISLT